jgi:hypothetical protein
MGCFAFFAQPANIVEGLLATYCLVKWSVDDIKVGVLPSHVIDLLHAAC